MHTPPTDPADSVTDRLFRAGNWAEIALAKDASEWRTFASLGLLGLTEEAVAGLSEFQGEEPRFYEAAALWIAGDEERAARELEPLQLPHARNLLCLIRQPVIRVLAQMPSGADSQWGLTRAAARDGRFEIIEMRGEDGGAIEPYADVRRFYDARRPPHFYSCLMVEWQHLPFNLQQLPCPILGATADFDVHCQTMLPWLDQFDELVVESQSQWHDLAPIFRRPVCTYARMAGTPPGLPPLPDRPREIDLFFSGTGLHPYHPDKARLLHECLQMEDVRFVIQNGYAPLCQYLDLLGKSRVNFTYVRYPGSMPTRGLDAISMGCALAVQRDCLLTLFLGEAEGVVTYSAEESGSLAAALSKLLADPCAEARARRGAQLVRREFDPGRLGPQYFRFLAFLAARPRDLRDRQMARRFDQKRRTLRTGSGARRRQERHRFLAANLSSWQERLTCDETPLTYGDMTREIGLELAVQVEQEGSTDDRLLQSLLETFHAAIQRFPTSLPLRFNLCRVCFELGQDPLRLQARAMAEELLKLPQGRWTADAMEDLLPWDVWPDGFNYRAAFHHVMRAAGGGRRECPELVPLMLASLSAYVAVSSADPITSLERAVELDPGFAIYRLRLAKALAAPGPRQDVKRAARLLAELARGSCVWTEAAGELERLISAGDPRHGCSARRPPRDGEPGPEHGSLRSLAEPAALEAVNRDIAAARRARESTALADASWRLAAPSARPAAEPAGKARIVRSPLPAPAGEPLVSALVPVYNAEQFLPGLLEDLERQTLAGRLEILVCDTGSPEAEGAIVAGYQRRHPNIVYIRTEHRETSHAALNRCVQAAAGRYLALACADDRRRPDALERLVSALERRRDCGVAYADSLITRVPNETFERNTAYSRFCWPEYSLRQLLMYHFFGPQPLWRRSLHDRCGLFEPNMVVAGDYDLCLRFARDSGAARVPEILGLYLEGGNESRNRDRAVRETQELLKRHRTAIPLEEIYPGLAEHAGPEARAAALVDFAGAILSSVSPDAALAYHLTTQARELIGDDPVVLNNLGVLLCMHGRLTPGMELMQRLAAAGSDAAKHNLHALRPGASELRDLQIGSLLHPVLETLPPLKPASETRQPLQGRQASGPAPLAAPCRRRDGMSVVVISGGEREEMLQLVLQSVRVQHIPDVELIVCGSHRPIEGVQVIEASREAGEKRRGAMRNMGMRAAAFDRVLFLDDDCLLAPGWYQALLRAPKSFDLLTMRMRLPDGSRYWDLVTALGPRGHRILLPGEEDEHVYATGGALLVAGRALNTLEWDEGLTSGEDMDFSHRARAAGFTLTHWPDCVVYHCDPSYTSIGRWTVRRRDGRAADWVLELKELPPHHLFMEAAARLARDETAEGVDCLRLGQLYYPEEPLFRHALAAAEHRSGGHLPGVSWRPGADPEYLAILAALQAPPQASLWPSSQPSPYTGTENGSESVLPQPRPSPHAGREGGEREPSVTIDPAIAWTEPWDAARPLFQPGTPPSLLSEHAGEAEAILASLEEAGILGGVQCFRTAGRAPLSLAEAARLRAHAGCSRAEGQILLQLLPPPACEAHPGLRVMRAFLAVPDPPASWVSAWCEADAVWAGTPGTLDRLRGAGVASQKLRLIPVPIITDRFREDLKPLPIPGARGFNFLFAFDWGPLSGSDLLLSAFVQEFREAEDVALILRPAIPTGSAPERVVKSIVECVQRTLGAAAREMPTLVVQTDPLPAENIPNLYGAADCFVAPLRSDGAGLRVLEAMASGLPIVAPAAYCAAADYVSDETGYPVICRPALPPEAISRQYAASMNGCRWLEPDQSSLRCALRRAFEERAESTRRGAAGREAVVQRNDYRAVSRLLVEEAERLGVEGVHVQALLRG